MDGDLAPQEENAILLKSSMLFPVGIANTILICKAPLSVERVFSIQIMQMGALYMALYYSCKDLKRNEGL